MKRPNITPGEWKTAHEFPGAVIAGEVEDSPRGKAAFIVAKIMGNALPTYKANARAIASVPKLLLALEDCLQSLERMPETEGAYKFTCIGQAKAALIEAGYTFD